MIEDITTRLRRDCMSLIADEAADEIERLRARIAEASDEAQLARSTITDLTIEVEKLRDERDEARQMFCNAMTDHCEEDEARQIAKEQGWDCFKEDGK